MSFMDTQDPTYSDDELTAALAAGGRAIRERPAFASIHQLAGD